IGHTLPIGVICHRRRVAVEHAAYVGNDSDQDLHLFVFTYETPAQRIWFSGPEEFCRLFREHGDAMPPVSFLERSALRYGNVHRAEIPRTSVAIVDRVVFLTRCALEVNRVGPDVVAERGQRGDNPSAL